MPIMPPQSRSARAQEYEASPLRHSRVGADRMITFRPAVEAEGIVVERSKSFLEEFASSRGPPQIVILMMLLALGFGSTIGVVPAVMSDRYARLHHGYDDTKDCSTYTSSQDKPEACFAGSADAQNAVAVEHLISNIFTFFTSSYVGSLSDEHGRRTVLLIGVFMSSLSPLLLLFIQLDPQMSPTWYYTVGAIQGLVNWVSIALSALSDVMPRKWRAPSFGMLLAGFSFGFALAPQLALWLGHFKVTIMSLSLTSTALVVVYFFFPETVPPEASERARLVREEQANEMHGMNIWLWRIYRPLWELTILNRSRLFRLLSALAFFSGIVSAGDQTLLLYYLEGRLNFNDRDVATMFLIMGLLGIFVQSVLLKIFNDRIGERYLVMLCFLLGTLHNTLYGLAENKQTVFVAVAIGSFVSMSFPTISAIKSNNVDKSEQGRIQGALYSLSALASAVGPVTLRFVYHCTKDGALAGPGTMFLFAGLLYAIASYCAFLLPPEAASNYDASSDETDYSEVGAPRSPPSDQETPLL